MENHNYLDLINDIINRNPNNRIKTLIMENYECHEYTVVDFDEHYNVLVGESRQGKSATLRCLDWIYYNDSVKTKKDSKMPPFVMINKKECRGTVKLFNDFEVTRELTPSKNRYIINHPEFQTPLILQGFGVHVPKEVESILGAYKIKLDDDKDIKLTTLSQGNGWFLIDDSFSSTVKSKVIGLIYGVHYIDKAIKDTKNDLDKSNRNASRLEEEVSDLTEKAKQYEYLSELKKNIDEIQCIYDQASKYSKLADELIDLQINYKSVCKEYKEAVELIESLQDIDNVENLILRLDNEINRLKDITDLANRYGTVKEDIFTCERIISYEEAVKSSAEIVSNIEHLVGEIRQIEGFNNSYIEIKEKIKENEKIISFEESVLHAEKMVTEADGEYDRGSRLKPLAEELKDKNMRISNCNMIINLSKDIPSAEKIVDNLISECERAREIQKLATPYKGILHELRIIENILEQAKDIDVAYDLVTKAITLNESGVSLDKLALPYKKCISELADIDCLLDQTKDIYQASTILEQSETLLNNYNFLMDLKQKYIKILDSIKYEDDILRGKTRELDEYISKYEVVLRELGICPVCMSEINETVIGHLIAELHE